LGYLSSSNTHIVGHLRREIERCEQRLASDEELDKGETTDLLSRLVVLEKRLASLSQANTKARHQSRADQYERMLDEFVHGRPMHKDPPPPYQDAPAGGASDPAPGPAGRSPGLPSTSPRQQSAGGDRDALTERAESMITRSKVTWDDIAGLEDTKADLVEAVNLFLARRPEGTRVADVDKLLFYGPPGTGKTLLASAAAGLGDCTFFNVGVNSDLLSKWVGEAPKTLSAVYKLARERGPSIVFLDEVTEIASRSQEGHNVKKELHDTLLVELDGLTTKGADSRVLTVAATNFPWDLSSPVLNRFTHRIYIPMPDIDVRERILEIHTVGWGHKVTFPLRAIAEQTQGYSGREIEALCKRAIKIMIREMNPWVSQPEAGSGRALEVAPLEESHFTACLKDMRPTVTRQELERYEQFRQGERH
jgi:katanin p60 ATPase-containing subunit A1